MPRSLVLVTVVLLSSCSKIVVVPVNPDAGKEQGFGVFYALPETVIRTEVTVKKTTYTPGAHARFAPLFAPGQAILCKDDADCASKNRLWLEGAALTSYGRPDPEEVYLVKFSGRGAVDQKLALTWNELGLPASVGATVTNRTTDLVLSGFKLAAGLAQRAGFAGRYSLEKKTCEPPSDEDGWILELIEDVLRDAATEAIVSNYCAIEKVERDRYNETRDGQSLEAALRAYRDLVLPLVTGRTKVLQVDSIYVQDAGAYLDRLDALLAQEIRTLFLGSKTAKTAWTGTLDVVLDPSRKPPQRVGLLRIDPAKGVCATVPLAPTSKPIPSDILLATDCEAADGNEVILDVAFHPDEASQLFSIVKNGVTEPDEDKSFRYRMPAQVRVQVEDEVAIPHPELLPGRKDSSVEVYGAAVLSVAQLGHVAALPAKRNSKELMYELAFVEATGGLKSFKLGSTGALDSATLDSLGTTATGYLDARKAARDAAEAEADELAQLQRRAAILKAQKEICEVLTTFNLPCEFAPETEGPSN